MSACRIRWLNLNEIDRRPAKNNTCRCCEAGCKAAAVIVAISLEGVELHLALTGADASAHWRAIQPAVKSPPLVPDACLGVANSKMALAAMKVLCPAPACVQRRPAIRNLPEFGGNELILRKHIRHPPSINSNGRIRI